jgi:hypothetical protein
MRLCVSLKTKIIFLFFSHETHLLRERVFIYLYIIIILGFPLMATFTWVYGNIYLGVWQHLLGFFGVWQHLDKVVAVCYNVV